jgi:hypothetical protein
MPRPVRAVVAVVALLAPFVGCGDSRSPSVGISQPAAFEMTVIGEAACPSGTTATMCVRVRISNRGDEAGDGYRRLRGHTTTDRGLERQILGPIIRLTDLAGHSATERLVVWERDPPEQGFSGYCEPGLRV